MTHRLRLTVPADHHVAFYLPREITGEVEIVVTPLEAASEPVVSGSPATRHGHRTPQSRSDAQEHS